MDNVIGRGQRWDLIQDCWAQWPGQEIFQNSGLEDCNRLTVENENNTSVASWKSCVNSTNNNNVNQTNIKQQEIAFEFWRNMTNQTDFQLDEITQNTTLYMTEGQYLCMNQTNNDSKSLEGK